MSNAYKSAYSMLLKHDNKNTFSAAGCSPFAALTI